MLDTFAHAREAATNAARNLGNLINRTVAARGNNGDAGNAGGGQDGQAAQAAGQEVDIDPEYFEGVDDAELEVVRFPSSFLCVFS